MKGRLARTAHAGAPGAAPAPARRTVRIASGQGFWGDDPDAPVRQVEGGDIDYLMLDYLAEVTMSIMRKQRARDPRAGYARDFVTLMERIFPACVERGIRVVTNAGGVNPTGCARAVAEAGRRAGTAGRARVGVVTGDDLMDRLDGLLAAGHPLANMETGEPLRAIRDRVLSANVYLGAGPIVAALDTGATVVVTGRSTDTALTYAPMVRELGWPRNAWDLLASGVVAGSKAAGARTARATMAWAAGVAGAARRVRRTGDNGWVRGDGAGLNRRVAGRIAGLWGVIVGDSPGWDLLDFLPVE